MKVGYPCLTARPLTVGEPPEVLKAGLLTMAVFSAPFRAENTSTLKDITIISYCRLRTKTDPKVNSGIFIRWADLEDAVQSGLEIQILDTHGKEPTDSHDCGALYDALGPTRNTCKAAGEWNEMIITCDGSIVAVTLNGEEIVRADLDEWDTAHQNPDGSRNKFGIPLKDFPRSGHIGIQDHGGKIWCRNIKVKSL